jgi:hypothetical protein
VVFAAPKTIHSVSGSSQTKGLGVGGIQSLARHSLLLLCSGAAVDHARVDGPHPGTYQSTGVLPSDRFAKTTGGFLPWRAQKSAFFN